VDIEYKFIPRIEAMVCEPRFKVIKESCNTPEAVADLFINGTLENLVRVAQERFILLSFNAKNEVLSLSIISEGTLNFTYVHPREVVKHALLSNACSVAFIHNHLSGNCEPGIDDISLTSGLIKAFEIFRIPVLDHIIISGRNWYSFLRHGLIERRQDWK
jgi:DNA repair protein RadC